jgi:peptidoglycan/xylan/chitin deacetylase (PgdA/CDA1 family)
LYFGSVKFFKHLIIFFIVLIFVLPIALAVIFGIKFSNTSDRLDEISEYISEHSASPSESESSSGDAEELYLPDPTPSAAPASDGSAKGIGKDKLPEDAEASAAPDSEEAPGAEDVPGDSAPAENAAEGEVSEAISEGNELPPTEQVSDEGSASATGLVALKEKIDELSSRLSTLEDSSSKTTQQTVYTSNSKELEREIGSLRSQLNEIKENASAPAASPAKSSDENEPAYLSLYPELYVSAHTSNPPEAGSLYLSFDGALSSESASILDKLDSLGIKAAFFVCPAADGSDAQLISRIARSGHTLGVYCFNASGSENHSTVEDFLSDFSSAAALIKSAAGVVPSVFRFPASSIRASNLLLYTSLMSEMTRRGYTYFDYTVDSLDGDSSSSAEGISAYVSGALNGLSCGIIRFHSDSSVAADAIELMVPELISQGFHFEALNETVTPVSFPTIQE